MQLPSAQKLTQTPILSIYFFRISEHRTKAEARPKGMGTSKLKQVVVVLVEDESGVRSAMTMLLEAFGFSVEAYPSANEALHSRYCRPGPDNFIPLAVIVSDVRMPGLDGFEFLTTLRRSGVKTPFILVSGHATKDELSRGLALGAQGFLSKPYEPTDLVGLIDDLSASLNAERGKVHSFVGLDNQDGKSGSEKVC